MPGLGDMLIRSSGARPSGRFTVIKSICCDFFNSFDSVAPKQHKCRAPLIAVPPAFVTIEQFDTIEGLMSDVARLDKTIGYDCFH